MLNRHQLKEITQIMGINKDTLDLLPKPIHSSKAMNPWVECKRPRILHSGHPGRLCGHLVSSLLEPTDFRI